MRSPGTASSVAACPVLDPVSALACPHSSQLHVTCAACTLGTMGCAQGQERWASSLLSRPWPCLSQPASLSPVQLAAGWLSCPLPSILGIPGLMT